MQTLPDLHLLVDQFAAAISALGLDGDDQEEYSTVLCRLENQADRDEPNQAIVEECLTYFSRFRIGTVPECPAA